MKKCPYCGEDIQDAAKKCRYCGEWLPTDEPAPVQKTEAEEPAEQPAPQQPAEEPVTDPQPEAVNPQPETVSQQPESPEPPSETTPEPQPEMPVFQPAMAAFQPAQPMPYQQQMPPEDEYEFQEESPHRKYWLWGGIAVAVAALLAAVYFLFPGLFGRATPPVEYYPFQESQGGKWGLISPEGEILFADKFEYQPSMAFNGRFTVQDDVGMTTSLYTAEAFPRKIGEYTGVGLFLEEDVTPAVKKGQPITFIDRDGNVKTVFDQYNGMPISSCTTFYHGRTVFQCGDYFGMADTKGNVVVEPEYLQINPQNDGSFIAMHKRYENIHDEKNRYYVVLDRNGKEKMTFNASRYRYYSTLSSVYGSAAINNGQMMVLMEGTGENKIGIMNFKEEWVVNPTKKIKQINQHRNGMYIVSDGEKFGLMDKNGEMMLPYKYDFLCFMNDDHLWAKRNEQTQLLDLNGEKLCSGHFPTVFLAYNNRSSFAKDEDGQWYVVHEDGEKKHIKEAIENISSPSADGIVFSDQVDMDDLIGKLQLSKNSCMGFKADMKPQEAIKNYESLKTKFSSGTGLQKEAFQLNDQTNLEQEMYVNNLRIKATADYILPVARSLSFTDNGMKLLSLDFSGWPYETHIDQLLDKLKSAVRRLGTVVGEGKNAIMVKTGENQYYFVGNTGKVMLVFGDMNPALFDPHAYDNPTDMDTVSPPPCTSVSSQSAAYYW